MAQAKVRNQDIVDGTIDEAKLDASTNASLDLADTALQPSAISDTVYGAGWNGDTTHAPSKNAVYDKIETLSGVTDGDKGDITVSASGATWTIDNGVVTFAKMQAITDGKLLGASGGTAVEEITVGSGLSLASNTLTATGGTTTPKLVQTTLFETSARFSLSGTGTASFVTTGLSLSTTSTANRYAKCFWDTHVNNTIDIFSNSPSFNCVLSAVVAGTTAQSFFGIGTLTIDGTSITYTNTHIGFKIITSGSVLTLSATQADGSTENASSLTTIAADDTVELFFQVNGSSSVDYYYRINGGTMSAATNLTSNMPATTTNSSQVAFMVNNANTASSTIYYVSSASYSR